MSWRDHLLVGLDPLVAPLVIIADPDGLLRDAELTLALTQRGYTVLPYADQVVFRLAYESALTHPLIVVVWERDRALTTLPYDLLARGVLRTVGLAEYFPRLHIPVLTGLQPADLDRLWPIYGQRRGPLLGAHETAVAVLQLCFGLVLSAIQTPADALTALLQVHTADRPLPPHLADLVQHQLARIPLLSAWPVEAMIRDHGALDAWLSQAWPRFLIEGGHLVAPANATPRLDELRETYHRAPALPFDDPRIWPIIDTRFLAGRLTPLRLAAGWQVAPPYALGVVNDKRQSAAAHDREVAHHLLAQLPPPHAAASDWLSLAPLVGDLLMRAHETTPAHDDVTTTLAALRRAFAAWVPARYGTLLTAAALPKPRLVSHLAPWMAMERQRGVRRHVLLVVDGLALDQWALLRTVWAAQGRGFTWDEQALFAWLPTLTSVSRQAIFAGEPPSRFPSSLDRTDREEAHWRRFWAEHGLQTSAVAYRKGLHGLDPAHADDELTEIAQLLETPGLQVVGLVVDAVDTIAHGMRQGEAGMLQQVRQWAETGWLARLVEQIRAAGFQLTLTSDHGNVAARGVGRPADGVLAEGRGLRARIYRDTNLRDRMAIQYPGSLPWDGNGLPAGIAALLAADGQAFAPPDTLVVAHGGADLRELLVPWCILR